MSKGVVGSILGAAVLLLALLGAGCGGDDEGEALTKAQFLKQGNAICKKSEEERGKVIAETSAKFSGKEFTLKQQEDLILQVLPTYENAATKIEELGAPEGDEEKVEEIVKAMEEAAVQVKASPGTALETNVPFKEANELVEKYGLDSCVA